MYDNVRRDVQYSLDASSDPESRGADANGFGLGGPRRRLRVGPEMTMLVGRSIDDCV
jgi:hypothetical protein